MSFIPRFQIYDSEDVGPVAVWTDSIRARKEYVCAGCTGPIAKGEVHLVQKTVLAGEGGWTRHRYHFRCWW